jgi:hypothetical protein
MALDTELDIKMLDGGSRLLAIAMRIGDPNNSYEIGSIKNDASELGDLEPFYRFILNNRAAWNAMRHLPHDLFVGATQNELKSAYSALSNFCDGPREWNGKIDAPIEGLSVSTAIKCLREMDAGTEPLTLGRVPHVLAIHTHTLISDVIRAEATQFAAQFCIELSPLYNAAFSVDFRSIMTVSQLFHAIPLFYIAALSTEEVDIAAGLDYVAIRNGFHNFVELQDVAYLRFGIQPQQWCDASEATQTELAGNIETWEQLAKIRRLVRRYRHTLVKNGFTTENADEEKETVSC